ncbi:MAG TPA: carboxypeptidase-like regulatory domain-containing protein, partial [Chitinophagaceae bacterium]|nr:carboxypeptidase-like regulatory domain-containing protein [Chitinophagaceae bacterium]
MKSLCTRYMLLLLLALTTLLVSVSAQKINGVVKDMQSDEPIPFASAVLKNAKSGALTDSLGKFSIVVYQSITNDTLQIFSVGYKPAIIPLTHFNDSVFIEIKLEVLPPVGEAVVKAKYN